MQTHTHKRLAGQRHKSIAQLSRNFCDFANVNNLLPKQVKANKHKKATKANTKPNQIQQVLWIKTVKIFNTALTQAQTQTFSYGKD